MNETKFPESACEPPLHGRATGFRDDVSTEQTIILRIAVAKRYVITHLPTIITRTDTSYDTHPISNSHGARYFWQFDCLPGRLLFRFVKCIRQIYPQITVIRKYFGARNHSIYMARTVLRSRLMDIWCKDHSPTSGMFHPAEPLEIYIVCLSANYKLPHT